MFIAWLIIYCASGTVLAAMFFVAYGFCKAIEAEADDMHS